MVFRLYDAATGGTLLWTGTHTAANSNAVTVTNGNFRVLLGSGTGNSIGGVNFNSADIYLGITIESDSEMTPRQRLGAAPYAFNADTVDGYHASDFLSTSTTDVSFVNATATNAVITNLTLTGPLTDSLDSVGTSGYVLQTTGGGVRWVATSSLGISGGGSSGASGVAGAIQFSDGTNLTSDATNFFWDTANNRLGIGTTTPGSALTIATGDQDGIYIDSTGTARLDFDPSAGGGAVLNNVASTGFFFRQGNSTQVTFDSSGNVGIGTTSPSFPLVISNGSTNEIQMIPSSRQIRFTGGNAIFDATSSGADILFETGNIERVRIDSAGNVGIGTTTPDSLFTIYEPTSSYNALSVTADVSTNINLRRENTPTLPDQYMGSFAFQANTGSGYADGALIRANAAESWGVGDTPTYLSFFTSPDGGTVTERLRIDENGNIGIGTTSPQSLLDVAGRLTFSENLTDVNGIKLASSTGYLQIIGADTFNSGAGLYLAGNNFAGAASLGPGDLSIVTKGATSDIRFQNGNTDLMIIDEAGRVGIGTTTPIGNLHVVSGASGQTPLVSSTLTLENNDNQYLTMLTPDANKSAILFGTDASSNFDAGIHYNDSATARGLQFRTNGNVTQMVLTQNGSLGIGTTSPNEILHIYGSGDGSNETQVDIENAGSAAAVLRILNSGSGDARLTFAGTGNTWSLGSDRDDSAIFKISDSGELGTNDRLVIDSSGNVGVGTTSPLARLHVTGAFPQVRLGQAGESGRIVFARASDGNTTGSIGFTNSTESDEFRLSSSGGTGFLTFETNGAERLRIDPSGNVGIGTTTPERTLSINSTLSAPVQVSSTGGTGTLIQFARAGDSDVRGYAGFINQGATGLGFMNSTGMTANLLVTDTGNIGIGTITPVAPLTVTGNANVALFGEGQTGNINTYFGQAIASNQAGVLRYDQANNLINLFVAGDSGSGLVVADGGNVGIGTTTPNQNLVVSSAGGSGLLIESTNTDTNNFLYFDSPESSANLNLGRSGLGQKANALNLEAAGAINFYPGGAAQGSESLVLDTSGNVGIGTTSPSELLHLSTTAGGGDVPRLKFTNAATGYGSTDGMFAGISNTDQFDIWNYENSDIRLGTNNATRMTIASDGNVGIGTTSPAAQLQVHSNGTQLRLAFDSSNYTNFYSTTGGDLQITPSGGDVYLGGNVGIGTTTPQEALNVAGKILLSDVTRPAINFDKNNTANDWSLGAGINGNFYLKPALFDDDTLDTDAVFTIDTSGNVGIGTTSPAYKLQVQGTGYFTDILTLPAGDADSSAYSLDSVAGDLVLKAGSDDVVLRTGGSGSEAIYFQDSAQDTKVIIDAENGNVGIGTSSPAYKLTVDGDIGFEDTQTINNIYAPSGFRIDIDTDNDQTARAFSITKDGATETLFKVEEGGSVGIGTSTSLASALTVQTNGASPILSLLETDGQEVFTVLENGNVGIGTTTPTEQLDVVGNIRVADNAFVGAGSGGSLSLGTGSNRFLVSDGSSIASIYTGGSERLRVSAAGNVGIGTTTPGSELVVAGVVDVVSSAASAINLESSAAATYFNVDNTNTGVSAFRFYNDGSSRWALGSDGAASDQFKIVASSAFSGSNEYFTINRTGGNVGIGTSSPSSRLHVAGDARIEGILYDNANSAGTNGMVLQSTGTGFQWVATSTLGLGSGGSGTFIGLSDTPSSLSADRIMFANSGGTALTSTSDFRFIDTGSDVTFAIGSAPTTELSSTAGAEIIIDGHGASGGTNNRPGVIMFQGRGTGARAGIIAGRNTNLTVTDKRLAQIELAQAVGSANGSPLGEIVFSTAQGSSFAERAVITANGGLGLLDLTPEFGFETAATSTNGYFGISSATGNNGDVFTVDLSGNVGIGTSTPASELHIVASDNGRDTFAASADNFILESTGDTGMTILSGTANTGNLYFADDDSTRRGAVQYDHNNDSLVLQTSGDDQFIIDSAGDVGIGTTTLTSELTVAGDIRVGTNGTNGCVEDYSGGIIGGVCSSDERLKTNIVPLADSAGSVLENLVALTPVTYEWNEMAGDLMSKRLEQENIGLIAQDVEAVFPELVIEGEAGYRQVKFSSFTFYIIQAIKDMWEVVSGNQEKIDDLEARILQLEAEINGSAAPADTSDESDDDGSTTDPDNPDSDSGSGSDPATNGTSTATSTDDGSTATSTDPVNEDEAATSTDPVGDDVTTEETTEENSTEPTETETEPATTEEDATSEPEAEESSEETPAEPEADESEPAEDTSPEAST